MFADYHMHSNYSNDSTYPLEDLVNRAIAVGLEEICLTEHSDYGSMGDYVVDYQSYFDGYLRVKEKYKDKIKIKFGCEFGMQKHTISDFEKDFKKYPFDFIILSNHQIDDQEFWTQDFQKGKTQAQYNHAYYQAILDVIKQYDNYSVLGHLDMIKRYDLKGYYDDQEVKGIIVDILKQVIKKGKGIEVNTSSFRYQLPDLTPSKTILQWYYDLGGKIITIGSDTHQEEHVGFGIQQIKKELKKIGFKQFCTYDKMKPIYHDL